MLTTEQKEIIINCLLDDGNIKGILEGTSVGDLYGEPGGPTEKEIEDYLDSIKSRELAYLGMQKRTLRLTLKETIHFEVGNGKLVGTDSLKVIENGAGNGRHLVLSIIPLLGDEIHFNPPVPSSIWLGNDNIRMIQEINK